ncbi:MAG: alcohol dehydrogenase catalytic domain-containing protein [Actinobacteria bacterium]|nr:alcohol dehydrogenase catalytic domain-containing protein [Actinomycetota bacterium]
MQPGVMQAVLVREVGGFEMVELPVPEPGPGEALIRVSVTGLCRTDLKIICHGHRDLTMPRVPGEEVVGEVVRLGPPLEPPGASSASTVRSCDVPSSRSPRTIWRPCSTLCAGEATL